MPHMPRNVVKVMANLCYVNVLAVRAETRELSKRNPHSYVRGHILNKTSLAQLISDEHKMYNIITISAS